jgi:hypothetical protein
MKGIANLVPYSIVIARRKLLLFWRKWTKKNFRRKEAIPILHLHLTDHCNLNCRACDNFSPLSPEVYADIEVFEKDCAKISELSKGKIDEIQFLGGEPLLHPKINDFIEVARKHFPSNDINIVTNGILLKKQPESFWECCRTNKIRITVTKYPVKVDYQNIAQYTRGKGIDFTFYGNTENVDKSMQCMPLDLNGNQNAYDSFARCDRANRCIALDNGKLYTCTLIPYVKYFNRRFHQNLSITPNDFIDIHTVNSFDEILDFICKPMPFCRYCNQKGMIWDVGYGISKKEMGEWTGEGNS